MKKLTEGSATNGLTWDSTWNKQCVAVVSTTLWWHSTAKIQANSIISRSNAIWMQTASFSYLQSS